MPEKIPIIEMRKWLEAYESGKTEIAIARKARRDVRTIKRGIEFARREHDLSIARVELVKDALHKHQTDLFETLKQIYSDIVIPNPEHADLQWVPSIINQGRTIPVEVRKGKTDRRTVPELGGGIRLDLLYEHLRSDPLWKVVADYNKDLANHMEVKIAFQRKIMSILKEKTGYDAVDEQAAIGLPNVIYLGNTGPLFFRSAIRIARGIKDSAKPENDITVDYNSNELKWGTSVVLAKVPDGNEDLCKKNLVAIFNQLKNSDEAIRVAHTYRICCESADKARKAVEEALLLGLIPGRCRICRRLGI